MKQMSAQLHTYVSHIKNDTLSGVDVHKILLRFVIWSFGVLAILYLFILGTMVKNIIERRNFEIQARALSSEVGDLELNYLSLSNNISLPLSYSLGFEDTHPTFATRKALGFRTNSDVKNSQNDI